VGWGVGRWCRDGGGGRAREKGARRDHSGGRRPGGRRPSSPGRRSGGGAEATPPTVHEHPAGACPRALARVQLPFLAISPRRRPIVPLLVGPSRRATSPLSAAALGVLRLRRSASTFADRPPPPLSALSAPPHRPFVFTTVTRDLSSATLSLASTSDALHPARRRTAPRLRAEHYRSRFQFERRMRSARRILLSCTYADSGTSPGEQVRWGRLSRPPRWEHSHDHDADPGTAAEIAREPSPRTCIRALTPSPSHTRTSRPRLSFTWPT